MVGAALRGAEENGFKLVRKPGRGLSNTWELSKNGKTRVASVRTTRPVDCLSAAEWRQELEDLG